mmetsp:Transcript_8602/g.16904  ORF Transcript_8602/g.16904 Transcript_8602/m.16904 type:complete len:219 (-) Transcript_8602:583-1239(-)
MLLLLFLASEVPISVPQLLAARPPASTRTVPRESRPRMSSRFGPRRCLVERGTGANSKRKMFRPLPYPPRRPSMRVQSATKESLGPREWFKRLLTTPEPPTVVDIQSKSQFSEIMANGNGLAVFMASMVNCGPCRVFDPKFRLFAEAYPDATFFKITGDTNEETKALLKDLRVSAVPAFRVFNDGKDVSAELALMEQMDIIQAEKTLRLVVKRHYPSK